MVLICFSFAIVLNVVGSVRLVTVENPVCIMSCDVWPVSEVRDFPISSCSKDQGLFCYT